MPSGNTLLTAPNRSRGLSLFDGDLLTPSTFFTASPWQTMRRMREEMDRMWSQFASPALAGGPSEAGQFWSPSVDVIESIKHWTIEVDLPGVNKDNVSVEVRNNQLIIQAEMKQQEAQNQQGQKDRQYHRRERRYGYFERMLSLPENVDQENISCAFKDGVLTCFIPKIEQAVAEGRHIPINDSQQSQQGNTNSYTRS
jgi:HSP20 family protein